MLYLCIFLIIIVLILTIRLTLLTGVLRQAAKQMEEIEQQPEANRQLKALTINKSVENLFTRINELYLSRQQERINNQRREMKLRREIENISHDLRTPLTAILGYIELIQKDNPEVKEKEEYLNIIKQRAKVLQGFIQDFYELSRMEGDTFPLLFDNISVQKVLSEVAIGYYYEFDKRSIAVELKLEDKQSYIIADQIQLNRILNNILQNALKYAGKLFVIKQYTIEKECILQFVNDKGSMTEKELEMIFDRFYCGDLSRNNNSTGLGLTITKILVEKMKGRINARLEEEMFILEICFPLYS